MKKLFVSILCCLFALTAGSPVFSNARDGESFSLTIYVDEGSLYRELEKTGHVFVRLSGKGKTLVRGFYPEIRGIGITGLGGGRVKDDGHLTACGNWDVKKTFPLTREQYEKASNKIAEWEANPGLAWKIHKGNWSLSKHCGDFALSIAASAGISLSFDEQWLDNNNRPGLFADYLKDNFEDAEVSPYRDNVFILLIDTSGSMAEGGKYRQAVKAATEFLKNQKANFRTSCPGAVSVMAFAGPCDLSSVRTIIPFRQDLDGAIRDLPGFLPPPGGETPLPQAIIAANKAMITYRTTHRGFQNGKIILLADGQSSCLMVRPPAPTVQNVELMSYRNIQSQQTPGGIERRELERSLTRDSRILAVGFGVDAGSPAERDLQYAAAKTGGRYVNAGDGNQLNRAFVRYGRIFSPRFPDLVRGVRATAKNEYIAGREALKSEAFDKAVTFFETYARHNPDDRTALFNLALALEANGQFLAAADSYRRFAAVTGKDKDRNLALRLADQMDADYRDQLGYHAKLVRSDVAYLENYFQKLYRGENSALAGEWFSFIEEKGEFYSNLVARTEIDEPWSRATEAKLRGVFEDLIRRTKGNRFDRDAIAKLPQAILLLRSLAAKLESSLPKGEFNWQR